MSPVGSEQAAASGDQPALSLRVADTPDADRMLEVIRAAFGARPPVDPPADFLHDTVDDVRRAIDAAPCVVAEQADEMVGCLLLSLDAEVAGVHRVSVLPTHRREGIAEAMVRGAVELATELGARWLELLARREFPETVRWWTRHGFEPVREVETGFVLRRSLPVRLEVPDTQAMHELGRRLAGVLQRGDVVIESGDLGAGKTTLTQGLGQGLAVGSPVTSPTFVLSRVHDSTIGAPTLVHVDAYRLGSAAELEDIDLDATLADAITVVEWGSGLAEGLSGSWLDVDIRRSDDPADETRVVHLVGTGERWHGVDLHRALADPLAPHAHDDVRAAGPVTSNPSRSEGLA